MHVLRSGRQGGGFSPFQRRQPVHPAGLGHVPYRRPKLLFRLACEYLSSSRVVRPGVVLILERVAAARARAREETWARLAAPTAQRSAWLVHGHGRG